MGSKATVSYTVTIRSCQGTAPDSDTHNILSIVRCSFAPKVLSEVEGIPVNRVGSRCISNRMVLSVFSVMYTCVRVFVCLH